MARFELLRYVRIREPAKKQATKFIDGEMFQIDHSHGCYDLCTNCRAQFVVYGKGNGRTNYCPNCGALRETYHVYSNASA